MKAGGQADMGKAQRIASEEIGTHENTPNALPMRSQCAPNALPMRATGVRHHYSLRAVAPPRSRVPLFR